MSTPITFFVPGIPKPAGSKRGFAIKKGGSYTGRVAIVDACKGSRDWKTDVSIHAKNVAAQDPLLTGPLRVTFHFYLPRPKNHFRSGKNSEMPKESAPERPTSKPDLLKLARAVEDALTGVVWADDSQIVSEVLNKFYTHDSGSIYGPYQPGVEVEIEQNPSHW